MYRNIFGPNEIYAIELKNSSAAEAEERKNLIGWTPNWTYINQTYILTRKRKVFSVLTNDEYVRIDTGNKTFVAGSLVQLRCLQSHNNTEIKNTIIIKVYYDNGSFFRKYRSNKCSILLLQNLHST